MNEKPKKARGREREDETAAAKLTLALLIPFSLRPEWLSLGISSLSWGHDERKERSEGKGEERWTEMIARAEEKLLISHFDGSKPQFLTCGSRFQPIEIVVASSFDETLVNVFLSDEATRMMNFLTNPDAVKIFRYIYPNVESIVKILHDFIYVTVVTHFVQ